LNAQMMRGWVCTSPHGFLSIPRELGFGSSLALGDRRRTRTGKGRENYPARRKSMEGVEVVVGMGLSR
jgi:hypothetical protein